MRYTVNVLFLAAFLLAAAAGADEGAANPPSSVTLPLADYAALVDRIAEIERAASLPSEPTIAEIAAQSTAVGITGTSAWMTTTFRVELRGTPTAPVSLSFAGLAERVAVEPRRDATLHRRDGAVVLVAPQPGSYAVTVESVEALSEADGTSSLRLPATAAPVATVAVELAAELESSVEAAAVISDEVTGSRRRLRLAPEQGKAPVLVLRRRVVGAEEERLLARAAVVTVVEPGADRLRRHEIVAYEVQRGELGTFELTLPPGLEVGSAASDEGDVTPLVDAGRLRVERRERLTGAGHLAVSFRPLAISGDPSLPLAAVVPRITAGERFLVSVPSVAAEVRPLPEAAWRRADLSDLPAALTEAVTALRPNAVWRLADAGAETSLRVAPLPAAERVGGVVWERWTSTLLSVDGSLVHRDRLIVREAGGSLVIGLPPSAVLWSAQVDGLAVRPIERGGEVLIPLAFKSAGKTVVELVAVEERSVETGRSRIRVTAPRLALPVVDHEWLLLLPEAHRYRFATGDLMPVPKRREESYPGISIGAYQSAAGSAGDIFGRVIAENGLSLPGVIVTLQYPKRKVISDVDGRFSFRNLAPGRYTLRASLEGFSTYEHPDVRVVARRVTSLEITMPLSEVYEQIAVTSETAFFGTTEADKLRREMAEREQQERFDDALETFDFGLEVGVKPLAVDIPESGKVLILSGVLPPAEVAVELAVRAR